MEPITIAVAATTLFLGAAITLGQRTRNRWHRLLRRLADERGWTYQKHGFVRPAKVTGGDAARSLTITTRSEDGQSISTVITVESPLSGIELVCAERLVTQVKKAFTGPDVELGVPDFDAAIELRGDRRVLLARLDAATQDAIRVFVKDAGRVSDGKVTAKKLGYVKDYQVLSEWSALVLEVSELLDPADPDEDRSLVNNVTSGSTAANRLACFEVINDDERRVQAAQHMLVDPHPTNRITGAVALDRADVLSEALSYALDPEIRIQGLRSLLKLKPDVAIESLRMHIASAPAGLATFINLAAEWAGQGTRVAPLSEVASLVEGADAEVGLALVYWAGCYGIEAEAVLIHLLAHPDDGVAGAAAAALESVGTLAAVHPLMTRSEGMMRSGVLKSNAREAIVAIQERHSGAGRGGLALAEQATGGELGLADDDEP